MSFQSCRIGSGFYYGFAWYAGHLDRDAATVGSSGVGVVGGVRAVNEYAKLDGFGFLVYLRTKQEESVAKALDAIRQTLQLAPVILEDFVRNIPAKNLAVVRRKGFWSIERHVFHLADVQPMLYERLRRFRDEEHPSFVPFIPSDDEKEKQETKVASVDEALTSLRDWRMRQVELVAASPEQLWHKVGTHPEYRSYTAIGLLRHIMMHDHWHMYRIEELMFTRDEYLTELQ